MKPLILIGSSLAAGALAGIAVHRDAFLTNSAPSAALTSSAPHSTDASSTADSSPAAARANSLEEQVLLGKSEDEKFSALAPEKQKEALLRISARILKSGGCGDQLLLARAMNDLGYEQAAALWEGISKTEGLKQDPANVAHAALLERLATLDPKRTLELGRKNEDSKVTQAAILAMAHQNGADALRALAQLPDKFRGTVAAEMRGGLNDTVGKASGNLSEMAAVLKEHPQLINVKSESEGAVRRLVGQVASQAAATDPVKAMKDLREMAAALTVVKPGEDPLAAQSALVARIASQMTRALRSDAPASARVVFNSLADTEKNATMVSLEASARLRESGTDTALQFAEKQTSPQYAKDAARGIWWSLAQQDRGAALQWIESLPQGAFREGALNSVMQEAAFRTRSWGDTEEALKAGAELKSSRSKLDYFAALAQQRRGDGSSQGEFISSLPLQEPEKSELRRRMAPIPLR
jgi:hypothetical protein